MNDATHNTSEASMDAKDFDYNSDTQRRTVKCPSCGGRHYHRGECYDTDTDTPIWICANCYSATPRQIRKARKGTKRARLLATMKRLGCDMGPRVEAFDCSSLED